METKSIDYVAAHERHGRVIDQVPFWFVGNFHFFTVAIGFVGPSMGLSFGYTALAGTLGILFGTIFAAFHASQGPQLGLPQMIQSRAQFGFRGVVLVLIGTLFTFIGFNVADSVLIAHGLKSLLGWDEKWVSIVALGSGGLLAVYGHDWLHRIFRWCFVACLPLYLILTVAIMTHRVPPLHLTLGSFTWVAFIAQFAASASYNLSYAPSVSDYSRYLPRRTRPSAIIASVFLGAASSAIWLIILGAWLATRLGATDGLLALFTAGNAIYAGFGVVLALAAVTVLVATMGLNAYCGMLTVVTGLNSWSETPPSSRLRVVTIAMLTGICIVITSFISENSISLVFAVLNVMLYLLVPWSSINLVDYFLVRHGRYAITELFTPHGIYGAWAARGLIAYAGGFLASLPFVVVPDFYTGPGARALGGVDIGWLVGLVVAAILYFMLSRSFDPQSEAAAILNSERLLD